MGRALFYCVNKRTRLSSLAFALFQQFSNDLIDDLIGQGADLIFGLGLDGMFDEDRLVLGHTQGGALGVGGANEFGRSHISGRDTLFFKMNNIVRTARNAAPSITEGFDDSIAFLRQLGFERCRSAAGHGRFHSAQDVFDAVLLT